VQAELTGKDICSRCRRIEKESIGLLGVAVDAETHVIKIKIRRMICKLNK
jgi:hypothetical protein